jgi:hypothetical protein
MAKNPKENDQFGPEETKRRMEAALKGARIAGPQHKIVTPKRKKAQRKKKS